MRELYDLLIEAPEQWEGPEQVLWLARNTNGLPCGFAGLLHWTDLDVGYLSGVGVRPAWRGDGLHSRMLRVRKEWAEEHGVGALVTYVVPDNYASLKGLLNFGFRMRQLEGGRWKGYHAGALRLSTATGPMTEEIARAQIRMFPGWRAPR